MDETLDLGFARVDIGRQSRQGLPEIVYGPGKQDAEITAIVTALIARNSGPILVTRVEATTAAAVRAAIPGGHYNAPARLLTWRKIGDIGHHIAVVTAGTSDGPVAAEASAVATALGMRVTEIRDVGVAGIHRLLAETDRLRDADTVIVIAGMEGALASVVGGLVEVPVIAVPTSVGYGAALEGVTALLAMLTSCAAGLTVVNIDSGFGAALAAYRLTRVSS
ncbi:nickel pincer cofactor biosynthesis protein LarB [Acrocarpospora sp. B8E8]|uniref:nickel pincer cofactor biosynthesis protein LarB n=1 Tax=Acrocarpospora sp. B8E8 TaxID=3153572 RepID=UPI00325D5967